MTDDTILSHAEALAEIKRLRERVAVLEALNTDAIEDSDDEIATLEMALATVERQREHIALLEATLVHRHGTWISSVPTPPDEPASFTGNLPPNAPPHNE